MALVGTSRPVSFTGTAHFTSQAVTFTGMTGQHYSSNPVTFTAPESYFAVAQAGSIVPVQPGVRMGDAIVWMAPPL